jgi:hypothetical protein
LAFFHPSSCVYFSPPISSFFLGIFLLRFHFYCVC